MKQPARKILDCINYINKEATDMHMIFVRHNCNPRGVLTTDCTTRAIAASSGIGYDEVREMQFRKARDTGYAPDDRKNLSAVLADLGYVRCGKPFKADGTTYRAGEMDSLLGSGESAVVQIARHVTCVSGGRLTDVWDCRGKSVYGYWVLRKGNGSRR